MNQYRSHLLRVTYRPATQNQQVSRVVLPMASEYFMLNEMMWLFQLKSIKPTYSMASIQDGGLYHTFTLCANKI